MSDLLATLGTLTAACFWLAFVAVVWTEARA